jgi:hypothetical protein
MHKERAMAKKATKAGHDLAMERLADAIESLDEAQALLAGEAEASEFWIGIIFSAQTSLQLVTEMAKEAEKEAARVSRRRKPAARKRR